MAEKGLSKLDREVARKIVRFLRERVAPLEDPRSLGEALKGPRARALLDVQRGGLSSDSPHPEPAGHDPGGNGWPPAGRLPLVTGRLQNPIHR